MTAPAPAARAAKVSLTDGEAVNVISALQEYAGSCRFEAEGQENEQQRAWLVAKAGQADELYERVCRA